MASFWEIKIEHFESPDSFKFKVLNTDNVVNGKIHNIKPIKVVDGQEKELDKWPEETNNLVSNWISGAKTLKFISIDTTGDSCAGCLFIINDGNVITEVKVILRELQLADNKEFLKNINERTTVRKMLAIFKNLTQFSGDYKQYLNVSSSKEPAQPFKVFSKKELHQILFESPKEEENDPLSEKSAIKSIKEVENVVDIKESTEVEDKIKEDTIKVSAPTQIQIKRSTKVSGPMSSSKKLKQFLLADIDTDNKLIDQREIEDPKPEKMEEQITEANNSSFPSIGSELENIKEKNGDYEQYERSSSPTMSESSFSSYGLGSSISSRTTFQSFFAPGPDPYFIYGPVIPNPITSINELKVDEQSKKYLSKIPNLGNHFYSLPHIFNKGATILIEPTVQLNQPQIMEASIFAILFKSLSSRAFPLGKGPCAIILYEKLTSKSTLMRIFDNLNCSVEQISIHVLEDVDTVEEQLSDIIGCHLMITTLYNIDKLMTERPQIGESFQRFRYLGISNIDRVMWMNELKYFLKPYVGKDLQIIGTSKSWNNQIWRMVRKVKEPMIWFGSMIEVAIFAKTEFALKFHFEEKKLSSLLDVLNENKILELRTAVVYSKPEEEEPLKEFLKSNNIPFGDGSNLQILSDSECVEKNISDFQHLIHYSIPSAFSKISKRFCLMAEAFKTRTSTKSTFMINDQSTDNVFRVLELLSDRFKGQLPAQVTEMANALKERKDNQLEHCLKPLCHNHVLYRICRQPYTCLERHFLNGFDVPADHLPLRGLIKIRIIKINSPVDFVAAIVKPEAERQKDQEVMIDFQDYYSENEAEPYTEFKMGDICAMDDGGLFRRCKIMEIEHQKLYDKIILFCLDTGKRFPVFSHKTKLLTLKEEFKNYPPLAVNIHLDQVKPIDQLTGWANNTREFTDFLQNIVDGDELDFLGTIRVTLNDHIYLDSLKVVEKSGRINIQMYDIGQELINRKYAVLNPNGGTIVFKMAEKHGIYSKVQNKVIAKPIEEKMQKPTTPLTNAPAKVISTKKSIKKQLLMLSELDKSDDEEEKAGNLPKEQQSSEGNRYGQLEDTEQWEDTNSKVFEYKHFQEFDIDDDGFNFNEEDLKEFMVDLVKAQQGDVVCKPIVEEPIPEETDFVPHHYSKITVVEERVKDKNSGLPRLVNPTKYPEMSWCQFDDYIKVRVKAADIKNYNIKISGKAIKILLLFNEEVKGAILNLFGSVVPKDSEVKLRGTSVIITLSKRIPGIKYNWSRLLKTKAKNNWLLCYLSYSSNESDDLGESFEEIFGNEAESYSSEDEYDIYDFN